MVNNGNATIEHVQMSFEMLETGLEPRLVVCAGTTCQVVGAGNQGYKQMFFVTFLA